MTRKTVYESGTQAFSISNMADADADLEEKRQKVKKEKDDLDTFIDAVYQRNKDYKYTEGFTEDNWREEIEKIPIFMSETPTDVNPEDAPGLAALQSLKYEDENPEAGAEAFKEDGNYQYKKKNFKAAIKAYTQGINMKCQDQALNAILYTNRATANFYLGNNRSALNDATAARKIQPNYMKAIIRGAGSCFELKLYQEGVQWCDDGLVIEPENDKLQQLRKKCIDEQKKLERDNRKAKQKERKEKNHKKSLYDAIKARGIRLEKSSKKTSDDDDDDDDDDEDDAVSKMNRCSLGSSESKVRLDESGALLWPVLFIYPEHGQSDFIASFNENHSFADHMHVMFGAEPAPWDTERKYTPTQLEVYFEDFTREKLCYVAPDKPLRDVLSDKRYIVREGTPAFVLLVKGSVHRAEFLQRYQIEQ